MRIRDWSSDVCSSDLIAALFQVADGAQVVAQGMLRGLHDTFVPMLFALFGYWVIGIGVGAWLAFERDWGGVGIWTGVARTAERRVGHECARSCRSGCEPSKYKEHNHQ